MPAIGTVQGLSDFNRDLQAFLQPETIHRRFREKKGKAIIDSVVGSAKDGLGPGDAKYPDYEDSYKEQLGLRQRTGKAAMWSRKRAGAFLATGKGGKARLHKAIAAGNKLWLWLTGVMLAKANFSWEEPKGDELTLKWTAPDEQVGIYAEVHNEGLPLGRNGPRKKREFMHFETTRTLAAVDAGYEQALRELTAQFSAGYKPR